MAGKYQEPFQKQHKLALQGLAFVVMMLAPLGLYFAARSGANTTILVSLLVMGVGMLLAAWVG